MFWQKAINRVLASASKPLKYFPKNQVVCLSAAAPTAAPATRPTAAAATAAPAAPAAPAHRLEIMSQVIPGASPLTWQPIEF